MHEPDDDETILHMCEWYENGTRYISEPVSLADGSIYALTEDWRTGAEIIVNHQLTHADGTPMPGIERLRLFDLDPGDATCALRDEQWGREKERMIRTTHERIDMELRALGVLGDDESIFE